MARTVTKNLASATIYVLDATRAFDVDENGVPLANAIFTMDGNPSPNRARIESERRFKTKNLMVLKIEVDETKLRVSPEAFYVDSRVCEEGVSYGREYVTQTFKVTYLDGFAMGEAGMVPFHLFYAGETTDNKLLNYAREVVNSSAIVTQKRVVEERRYMPRERYMELAR